jgi:hypothetical protein
VKSGIISIIILLLFSKGVLSQNSSRLGYELGFVMSGPQKFTSIYGSSYSPNPLISPLLGIKWERINSKCLKFTAGMQYEMFGTRYHKTNMPGNSQTYIERITIHKLCIPVGTVIKLNIEKKKYYVLSLGIRPQINLSGKYYNERYEPIGQGYRIIDEYNPLVSAWRFYSAERFTIQGFLGISKRLNKNDISFNFIPGYFLKFTQIDYPPYIRKLWNNEFSLSLIHFLSTSDSDDNQTKINTSTEKNHSEKQNLYLKNSIGISFGYIESSVNFERNLFYSTKSYWNIRAGFGIYTNPDSGGLVYNVYNLTLVYLRGKKSSHLELDAGVKYLDLRKDAEFNCIIPDLFAGYRYEKLTGRFYLKAGISNVEVINPSVLFGCGLRF